MDKNKGSITIFSLLALLLVTAALFALLEGTRLQELQRFGTLQTEVALESVFANYNSTLWEKYHLLGTEQEVAEEIWMEVANGRRGGEGVNLLTCEVEQGNLESYTRLTDGQGTVFIKSVSSYMKDNLLYEAAKEIYNQYEVIKNLMNTSDVDLSNIDEALREIELVPKESELSSVGTSSTREKDGSSVISILEAAKKWKENGALELFLEDTTELSEAEMEESNDLFSRKLRTRTSDTQDISWMDQILLQHYILTYLSNYGAEKEGRALSYEVEYLLGKKYSDKENLMAVITQVLAIREAANLIYLISDPVKIQQSETLALTLGGGSLNPIVIEVIRLGILTAWALGESILDVRALLAGRKIPLLKSAETWTLELENIELVTQNFLMAKESEWGLGYENYLGILLLFMEKQQLALRTMNVQEATIRKDTGNTDFGIDGLLVDAELQIAYVYQPVFPFLKVIDAEKRWEYKIWTKVDYGYY